MIATLAHLVALASSLLQEILSVTKSVETEKDLYSVAMTETLLMVMDAVPLAKFKLASSALEVLQLLLISVQEIFQKPCNSLQADNHAFGEKF